MPEALQINIVDVPSVSRPGYSVVTAEGRAGMPPVILVHGILDNVWRWITHPESLRLGIAIPERRLAPPAFDPGQPRATALATVLAFFDGPGLLHVLASNGIPAVAFSYQSLTELVADMPSAVERLHRIVAWSLDRFQTDGVILLGHSRGGLVCRHALLLDSPAMRAVDFRRSTRRLITLCTPHLGSRVAEFAPSMNSWITQMDELGRQFATPVGIPWASLTAAFDGFRQLIRNVGQLTRNSDEVMGARTELAPPPPEGYFAIAGSEPTFFRCDLPLFGRLRIPPEFNLPEFTHGQGDMAVAIPSALDIPDQAPDRTFTVPVNHMTAANDRRVHERILNWLS